MAQAFQVQQSLQELLSLHPSPEEFRAALVNASRLSREYVARLWLTEGTPFVFRDCPGVYEEVRRWLGARLDVCPKEITVVGSARIGFSLVSRNFGRPFSKTSDLDVAVVSHKLFASVVENFENWKRDYTTGIIHPRSDGERNLWDDNLVFGKKNLPKGFFDVDKLPTFDRYPPVQHVQQAMWVLCEKLKVTPKVVPSPRQASVRVYETWQDLVDRASLNLLVATGKS